MIRFLFTASFLILSSVAQPAKALSLDHCVYVLGQNHQNLLPTIYNQFQSDHPENICPVRFDVENETDRSKDCKGTDPGGVPYTQTAARAVLDYRNVNGELYTVTYPICLQNGPNHPTIVGKLDGSSWKKQIEVSIRKIVYPIERADGPDNNNDNCDTDRTVAQQVCAPNGYKVYAWEGPFKLDHSEDSQLQSIIPDPQNPSCIIVSFLLKGKGYDNYLGVKNCRGSAWFKYSLNLDAYTTSHP